MSRLRHFVFPVVVLALLAACSSSEGGGSNGLRGGEGAGGTGGHGTGSEDGEVPCPQNYELDILYGSTEPTTCPTDGQVCPWTGGDECISWSGTATCVDGAWELSRGTHDDCCPDEEPSVGDPCSVQQFGSTGHTCAFGSHTYVCTEAGYCDQSLGACCIDGSGGGGGSGGC